MSKIDDLIAAYNAAYHSSHDDQHRAGIAAVVRALRDEIESLPAERCRHREDINFLFYQILGAAGNEKVAGGPRPEAMGSAPPAADPAPAYPDEPLVVSPTGLGLSPAPAPAVCVWTDVGDAYRSACGRSHFAWTSRDGVVVCPECEAPIKFTEAK